MINFPKVTIKNVLSNTKAGIEVSVKTGFIAVNADLKSLVLVGETQPYMPLGGKKVLKEILETCTEGVHYNWI